MDGHNRKSRILRVIFFLIFIFTVRVGFASSVSEECNSLVDDGSIEPQSLVHVFELAELLKYKSDDGIQNMQNKIRNQGNIVNPYTILGIEIEKNKKDQPSYSTRAELVKSRAVGIVRQMDSIETSILNFHLKNIQNCDLVEFVALTFVNAKGDIRILYQTSGKLYVNQSDEYNNTIGLLIKEGYQLQKHLHNHPFIPVSLELGNGGMLYPSGDRDSGDVRSYIRFFSKFGLKEAQITNGFNTVTFSESDIKKM